MTHTYDYSVSPERAAGCARRPRLPRRTQRALRRASAHPTTEHADDDIVITAVRQLPMDKIPARHQGLGR